MAGDLSHIRKELKALAEALPFTEMVLPAFKEKDYEPVSVRQPRTPHRIDSSMQAVGRFLAERGVVDLLQPEQTIQLFDEIHWCVWQINLAARRRLIDVDAAASELVACRRMVSRIEQAEEELFIANRRLVVACVKPFFWVGQVWLSDFLQEGSKALCNAIRKFDHSRGTPFYAYAQKSIQNRMRNYFRDHVRAGSLGIRPTEEMMRLKQFSDQWKEHHGDEAPLATLSQLSGIPEDKIRRLRPLLQQWERMPLPPLSLDAVVGESLTAFHEIIEDTDAEGAAFAAEKSEIWDLVAYLPERSARILRLRFLEGRTLEETGERMSLTRARIKQIQDDSLRRLRSMMKNGPGAH